MEWKHDSLSLIHISDNKANKGKSKSQNSEEHVRELSVSQKENKLHGTQNSHMRLSVAFSEKSYKMRQVLKD